MSTNNDTDEHDAWCMNEVQYTTADAANVEPAKANISVAQANIGRVAAKSANKKGVKIISIFPEYLDEPGIIFSKSQKVIKTKNILERKKKMIELSDIFVCLPGGIGTLDEITEVLSSAALGEHSKPIFLINTNNFWSPFMNLLDHMEKNKFIRINGDEAIKSSSLSNLFIVDDFEELSIHEKFISA